MPSTKPDDPVSFTDTNADTGAGADKATGSAMMDLISGLQKQKGSTTSGGSSTTSGSTGRGKGKKKKKGKKKTVTKRKRRKDRYESQNYLLRIEGTLCCASIGEDKRVVTITSGTVPIGIHTRNDPHRTISVVAIIWLISLFIVMLICGIWSGFDFTATTDSVKNK